MEATSHGYYPTYLVISGSPSEIDPRDIFPLSPTAPQQPIHAVRDTAMVQLNCEGHVRYVSVSTVSCCLSCFFPLIRCVRSVLSLDQIWLQHRRSAFNSELRDILREAPLEEAMQHRLRDLELRMDATVQEAYDRGLTAEEHLLPLLLLLADVRMQMRS